MGVESFSFLVKHLQIVYYKDRVANERQNLAFCFGD